MTKLTIIASVLIYIALEIRQYIGFHQTKKKKQFKKWMKIGHHGRSFILQQFFILKCM